MKHLPPLLLFPLLALAGSVFAADPATQPALPAGWAAGLDKPVAGVTPICLNLWDVPAPNAATNPRPERDDGTGRITDVNTPGLLVYLPPKDKLAAAGGTCIIECMGGSYTHLTRLVGADNTVPVFVPQGITVVSLKYRLKPPSTDPERDAVLDGRRAIRVVRAHAKEWGIDPAKVGFLGWSAGGNLILSLTTHLDAASAGDPQAADPIERQSCLPDFVTLLSPWPNGKKIDAYPAGKDLPPLFMGSAHDDTTAPFAFAQAIHDQWEKAGGHVEFINVPTGGHGAYELLTGTAKNWPDQYIPWLQKEGFLKKPA